MENAVDHYRTNREKIYNLLLCLVGALLWSGIFYGLAVADDPEKSIRGILIGFGAYFALFLLFLFISSVAFRAVAMGNMILLGFDQFPHLYTMVRDGARKLGISPTPEVFLYNSGGLFNAFARQAFGKKYILLTASLVDASSDEQVKFVIGHELGHHAAGHLNLYLYLLRLPAKLIVPFLYSAYLRQCEYTCDRIGYFVSQDLKNSCSALQMLGCGCQRLNKYMNAEAFEKQEEMVPPITGFLTELFSSHPRLTRRVGALKQTALIGGSAVNSSGVLTPQEEAKVSAIEVG